MVAIEAILAGTPVIASSNGPLPEIVEEGKTGFLCSDGIDYEEAIKKINSISRHECRKTGIEKFSLDIMAKNYENLFDLALRKFN
jgi:glycosyltransferase involved in cell wall biosynthesis